MKKFLFALSMILMSGAALAQEPNRPRTDTLPIVVDAENYAAIVGFLQEAPYRFAAPIISRLQELQVRAQVEAQRKRLLEPDAASKKEAK